MPATTPQSESLQRLASLAKRFGCPELVPLTLPTSVPAQIQYLDILPTKELAEGVPLPQAVAEFQGRPVIYFLDGTSTAYKREDIQNLQQRLANRGEHAVLAESRPGQLTLYPLNLDRAELQKGGWEVIAATHPEAPFLFQGLACGTKVIKGGTEAADPVFVEIHRLMTEASRALAGEQGEGPLDGLTVLSMTGRALFFRFLMDRSIVRPEDLPVIYPKLRCGSLRQAFSTAQYAAHTSAWLDETFNGDLLPLVDGLSAKTPRHERRRLYQEAYETAAAATQGAVFLHLEAILCGYDSVALGRVQRTFAVDWDDLNFRHVPVGVLSQVYESFSHQWDAGAAKDNSVHYTPKLLAKLVVEQTMEGLAEPHRARVLDAACGAGVFLVLTFRELVRRRWERENRRPGTRVIHQVLYEQLCGFDVSESALRLAALGLYITAIELNEIIRPPSELHAPKPLKDTVLFNRAPRDVAERKRGFVLGSLGQDPDESFVGAFDAVVGNPPWSRLLPKGATEEAKKADSARIELLNSEFTAIGRRVLKARGLEEEAKDYENPGGVPDIPFIWRATEWVKPGGIIGLALEARLILTQSGPGKAARDAIFRSLEVTGILNGTGLEKTHVWPNIDVPWLLFWARNARPSEDHAFHFLTPVREDGMADRGEFRLDEQSAYPVSVRSLRERGWLLKALAMGTVLDADVIDRLTRMGDRQTVGDFWKGCCKGFIVNPRGDDAAPDWFLDLPVFHPPEDADTLPSMQEARTFRDIYGAAAPLRTRAKGVYAHPLLVVTERAGETRDAPKAYRILHEDTAFSQSYYGYSAARLPNKELCVALLHLIVHSSLFRHFCFMRSARVGAGRRTIYKEDVDAFPFPEPSQLAAADRATVLRWADEIDRRANTMDWSAMNRFVCKLFGLSLVEAEVVEETVEFNAPFRSSRKPAAKAPDSLELTMFAKTLEQALQPFFKVVGQRVRVRVVDKSAGEWNPPWRFVTVLLEGDEFSPGAAFVSKVMRVAADSSASRVVMAIPEGGLLLGLLNQRRFWTRTRARLCALHLAREHLEKRFKLPMSE